MSCIALRNSGVLGRAITNSNPAGAIEVDISTSDWPSGTTTILEVMCVSLLQRPLNTGRRFSMKAVRPST